MFIFNVFIKIKCKYIDSPGYKWGMLQHTTKCVRERSSSPKRWKEGEMTKTKETNLFYICFKEIFIIRKKPRETEKSKQNEQKLCPLGLNKSSSIYYK